MATLPWSTESQRAASVRARVVNFLDWLLCNSGCGLTRRLTSIVWCCASLFLLVDVVWLSQSPLRFARGNWTILAGALLLAAMARALAALAPGRVRVRDRRLVVILRGYLRRCELLCHHGLLLVLLVAGFLVFSYLATAAAWPLQDELLARVDRSLGFDWPAFLAATNGHPHVAMALNAAYHGTGLLLLAIVAGFSLRGREARLAELLAVLAFTCVGLAIGMIAVPSAGAFAYFAPNPEMFEHFAAAQRMWPFYATFIALRDGSLTVIAFSSAEGIVSFPSFHAALGVVTVWALRDMRFLRHCVVALNTVMLVAVMPVGGHHLSELICGVVTGIAAIAAVAQLVNRAGSSTPSLRAKRSNPARA